mmetsp:Transcript_38472/g.64737  ORF Transcript_38472/g.64737 Transcript_38472/m.64737 type:complete len:210 (-) Transcript_38472:1149-1778(-)
MARQPSGRRSSSVCPAPSSPRARGRAKPIRWNMTWTRGSATIARSPSWCRTTKTMRTTRRKRNWTMWRCRCGRAGIRTSLERFPKTRSRIAPPHWRECPSRATCSRPRTSPSCGSPAQRMKTRTTCAPRLTRSRTAPRPRSRSRCSTTQSWSAWTRWSTSSRRRATPAPASRRARATTRTAGSSPGRRATCSGTLKKRTCLRSSGSAAA